MSDTPPFPAVPQTRHRLLRGTELEHKSFVGMYGELTYDTTGNTVRVHDGKTAGGVALSKEGHTHDAFGGLPVPAPEEAGKFAQVKPGGGYGLVDPVAMSSVLADDISDAGTFGKVLVRAADSDAVRVALGSRTSATGTTTIYVRPTGNDSNSGTSVAAPKKTIMGAFKSLRDLDARGSGIAIDFDGTFTENISINDSFAPVTTTVVLRGASAATSKIIGYIQVINTIRLDVSACRIEGYIVAYEHAQVRLGDGLELHNATATTRLVLAYRGAVVTIVGSSIKISGDARAFLQAHQNGWISFTNSSCAVDFVGTPTYSIATAEAYSGGVIVWPPTIKCTGTVIGKRVVVDYAGSVSSGTTDPRAVIPGTEDGDVLGNGLFGVAGVPSGFIGMWSGAVNTIPSGWLLCDGTNGTPDLRNRFIIGAGSTYAPKAVGGATSATTSTAGAHGHNIGVGVTTLALTQIPSHAHGGGLTGSGQSISRSDSSVGLGNGGNTSAAGGSGGHNHTGSADSQGNHAHTVATLPPYYALCFIMKA